MMIVVNVGIVIFVAERARLQGQKVDDNMKGGLVCS